MLLRVKDSNKFINYQTEVVPKVVALPQDRF